MKEHDLTMTAEHHLVRLMKTMPTSRNSRAAFTLTELPQRTIVRGSTGLWKSRSNRCAKMFAF